MGPELLAGMIGTQSSNGVAMMDSWLIGTAVKLLEMVEPWSNTWSSISRVEMSRDYQAQL